jgi:hypothetical protein
MCPSSRAYVALLDSVYTELLVRGAHSMAQGRPLNGTRVTLTATPWWTHGLARRRRRRRPRSELCERWDAVDRCHGPALVFESGINYAPDGW